MAKYLIVVDVQKDFVDGALGTKEAAYIIPRVKAKIAEYKQNGDNIIFTRDTHTPDYLNTSEGKHLPVLHCVKDTDGWEIYSGLDTENAQIIDKPSFGFLNWGNYIEICDNLQIELIGLCTDICVISNALILKALFPEAEISVDSTACAGVTPETHNAALKSMQMCQINIL